MAVGISIGIPICGERRELERCRRSHSQVSQTLNLAKAAALFTKCFGFFSAQQIVSVDIEACEYLKRAEKLSA